MPTTSRNTGRQSANAGSSRDNEGIVTVSERNETVELTQHIRIDVWLARRAIRAGSPSDEAKPDKVRHYGRG